MRVLPILFNADMVRAILDGRKTVTRRVVKPSIGDSCPNCGQIHSEFTKIKTGQNLYCTRCGFPHKAPYQSGDILYVRESIWQKVGHTLNVDGETEVVWIRLFEYVSDEKPEPSWEWVRRPSIHMPKEAARIWLKVTDVRAERLQKITENQATAEGAIDNRGFINSLENEYQDIHSAREHFKKIWESTIKKMDINRYGWNANPWVWVIEFERCEKPEENEPAG